MEKFTDYSVRGVISRFFEFIDMKCIMTILSVELGMLLMAIYKGQGKSYLPIALLLMAFTVVGCVFSTWVKADKKMLVIIMVLLNLGFLVKQIQSDGGEQISSVLVKLSVALGTALFVSLLYSKMSGWFAKDFVILGMMICQLGISCLVCFFGQVIGAGDGQGATISIKGITPFEFVKILYIFIAAGLLCKKQDTIWIMKWSVSRSLLLIVHTACLSIVFVLCSELGTLLIVYITGLLMLNMFGPHEKWVSILETISFVIFLLVWFLSEKILFPLMLKNNDVFPGILGKIVRRFGVVFHPEFYLNDYGYQGTRGLMAIASGGWLGIGTERYRIDLPEANNDFIFANVIETCGILIGIMLITFILFFLKRSMVIAEQCKDQYYKGIASGIAIVIVVESIVHIGYNMALFPITGIPLYFLSQGFSAIITSMCLVAILLVLSVKNQIGGKIYERSQK